MDLGSVTATLWYYVTWPLGYLSEPIKQPLLGFILGWAGVWIFLHIGRTIVFYIALQLIIFLASERAGLITIHWRRLSELWRRPGVANPSGWGFPEMLNRIKDFMVNNCLFFCGLVVGFVIGVTM